jgi:hypothetical protein
LTQQIFTFLHSVLGQDDAPAADTRRLLDFVRQEIKTLVTTDAKVCLPGHLRG